MPFGKEAGGPCCTRSRKSESSHKEAVGRILELISEKTNERNQVKKAEVLHSCISQRWDDVEQRGCAANNGNLVTRDTHVPKREVYQYQTSPYREEYVSLTPDKDRQTSHDGPENKLQSIVSNTKDQ